MSKVREDEEEWFIHRVPRRTSYHRETAKNHIQKGSNVFSFCWVISNQCLFESLSTREFILLTPVMRKLHMCVSAYKQNVKKLVKLFTYYCSCSDRNIIF